MAPKEVNVLDFTTGIELASPELSKEAADQIHNEASITFKEHKTS